jgi:hypothetical protein
LWKCDVLSEELIGTFEGENYIVKTYKVALEFDKPKLEELIHNSKEYFDFLKREFGSAGEEKVNEIIEEWKKWLDSIEGNKVVVNITAVRVELKEVSSSHGSIQFYHSLVKLTQPTPFPTDPVNLVFYGPAGSAWDVQYDMKNWLDYKWTDTAGRICMHT